jgi:hypothetical protein
MNHKVRFAIVLILFLGILALALNQPAWAGRGGRPAASAPQAGNPAPAAEEVQKGTVRPPDCGGLTVRISGDYSICGFAIIHVNMKQEDVVLTFVREKRNTTPGGLSHILVDVVRMFVRVANKPHDGSISEYADVQICYAVPPNSQVQIMYHGIQGNDQWIALATTIKDGEACATADLPGYYALVPN